MVTGRRERLTVLLVEDDDVDVTAVRRAFRARAASHELVVARDGQEALAMLRGQDGHAPLSSPHIILLDLNLPRMNGLEFLSALRSDAVHHEAVVFVLTTSDAERDRRAAYQHHVAGYVVKSALGHDLAPMLELLHVYQSVVSLP